MMTHYPDSNSNSARLFERACAVLLGGISRLTIAQNPYPVYDADKDRASSMPPATNFARPTGSRA